MSSNYGMRYFLFNNGLIEFGLTKGSYETCIHYGA